ncbi:MAG: hypothetical protein QXK01_05495 [Thermofilum sp.]|uniref:hypothetical protein n=1 Tax=Thermofilum sp. TaxID=1961369 RepID=UPI003161FC7C
MAWRVVVSTCRHDTVHVRRLARELAMCLPGARRVNRGGRSLGEMLALARYMGARRLVVVYRGLGGNPGRIAAWDVGGEVARRIPATLYLRGVVFSGDKRIPRASSDVYVYSLGEESEYGLDIASMFDLTYVGVVGVDELGGLSGRVLLVEPVKGRDFLFVLKFYENGAYIGPRMLVKSVRYYRARDKGNNT